MEAGIDVPSIEETKAIAEEAYLYGLPIIMNHAVMNEYSVNKDSGQFKAPFNQIHNEARVFTYRVPCAMRWPGVVKPGTEINHITSHEDSVPTLVAAAGDATVKEKLLTGHHAAGKSFKVHLDGYDQRDVPSGTGPGKRSEFFYWTDDGNLAGLRYERWKMVFLARRAEGFKVWPEPMVPLRLAMLVDVKGDPFERAMTDAGEYDRPPKGGATNFTKRIRS